MMCTLVFGGKRSTALRVSRNNLDHTMLGPVTKRQNLNEGWVSWDGWEETFSTGPQTRNLNRADFVVSH